MCRAAAAAAAAAKTELWPVQFVVVAVASLCERDIKCAIHREECIYIGRGAHLPFLGREPVYVDKPLKSDAWPVRHHQT